VPGGDCNLSLVRRPVMAAVAGAAIKRSVALRPDPAKSGSCCVQNLAGLLDELKHRQRPAATRSNPDELSSCVLTGAQSSECGAPPDKRTLSRCTILHVLNDDRRPAAKPLGPGTSEPGRQQDVRQYGANIPDDKVAGGCCQPTRRFSAEVLPRFSVSS
jgi:hypothetical protein